MKNKDLLIVGGIVALLFLIKKTSNNIGAITTSYFMRGDEVYKIGNSNPFGMVVGTGEKNVMIVRHSDGKKVAIKPNKLYLARDWNRYNKQK